MEEERDGSSLARDLRALLVEMIGSEGDKNKWLAKGDNALSRLFFDGAGAGATYKKSNEFDDHLRD